MIVLMTSSIRCQLDGITTNMESVGVVVDYAVNISPKNETSELTTPPTSTPSGGEEEKVKGDMVFIPGGTFTMGSKNFYPEENPLRKTTLTDFWIDKYEVTNKKFGEFVEKTNHVTFAEIPPIAENYPTADPSLLVPGSLVFYSPQGPVDLMYYDNWWKWVPGADWRHPQGPDSDISKLDEYPVVHVTYADAMKYCEWRGKSLPTEAQYEYAARGGLEDKVYAWGDTPLLDNQYMANYWQGNFPWQNTKNDGHFGAAPVGSYPPNGYGLYDIIGNVWEWTNDWFTSHPQPSESQNLEKGEGGGCTCAPVNPRGPPQEESYDPNQPEIKIPSKVLKGGSYLCASNYCLRYRPSARSREMVDSSTNHIGFRCVVDTTATTP